MEDYYRSEKERHKAELKAAKKAYKESLRNGNDPIEPIIDSFIENERERQNKFHSSVNSYLIGSHNNTSNKQKKAERRPRIIKELNSRHKPGYVDPDLQETKKHKPKFSGKIITPKRKTAVRNEAQMSIEEKRRQWIEQFHLKELAKKTTKDVPPIVEKKQVRGNIVISDHFPLHWKYVDFYNGQIIIRPFTANVRNFRPFKQLVIERKDSRRSFNYLRTYFEEKLPTVMCYTHSLLGLIIVDNIKLNLAITTLNRLESISDDIEIEEGSKVARSKFDICCKKGNKLTEDDFKEYKSEFINYLIKEKSISRKIIPCQECLRYEMSKDTYDMEDAFMFVLPNFDGSSTIVYENLNIDRSTLLFKAEKGKEMDAARQIFTFMNGMDLNKRSNLRNKWIRMKGHGIIRYKSINHTELWDWKYNLSQFRNGWGLY